MKSDAAPKRDYSHGTPHLEPRVAKLELGMERLTDDVRDLAQVVRSQGSQMEQEIQKLVIAVTQAAGPRKTDWSTIIAGIMLILALAGAAFWPLNQQVQDLKTQQNASIQAQVEHQKMDNHPVGAALVQRLEEQLKTYIDANQKQNDTLRLEFQKDMIFSKAACEENIKSIREKYDMWLDKLSEHVVKLQEHNEKIADEERAELHQWRQKAMGLSSPDAIVPLVRRDQQKQGPPLFPTLSSTK